MKIMVHDAEAMEDLGARIAPLLKGEEVIYLYGELGAGKTTFTRGLARGIGYEGRVASPTFVLMNIYEGDKTLFHYDFYRLQAEDLDQLGWEDYLDRQGIAVIEWPQAGQAKLPREALHIHIDLEQEDYDKSRIVSISATGEKYIKLLKELETRC